MALFVTKFVASYVEKSKCPWYREFFRSHLDWIQWSIENPEFAEAFWEKLWHVLFDESKAPAAHILMSLAKQSDSFDEWKLKINRNNDLAPYGVRF